MMLKLLVLLLAVISLSHGWECPADRDLYRPCTCGDDRVSCIPGNSPWTADDLDLVMKNLKQDRDQLGFKWFELSSTSIDELPALIFHNIWLDNIIMNDNTQLHCVSPSAFVGSEQHTITFVSRNNNFSSFDKHCNIFSALSTMEHLETVNITRSLITEIPDNAFQGAKGHLENLHDIFFTDHLTNDFGEITRVGKNAFSQVKNLRNIDLSYQKIETIDTFAFTFLDKDGVDLVINLEHSNNTINGSSFCPYAFDVGNRKLTLKLGGNLELTFLKDTVFRQLLTKETDRIRIELSGNRLEYCKENAWLLRERAALKLHDKIVFANMNDGIELWQADVGKFTEQCDTGSAACS